MKFLLIIWVISNGHDHTMLIPVKNKAECKKQARLIGFTDGLKKSVLSCVRVEWSDERVVVGKQNEQQER